MSTITDTVPNTHFSASPRLAADLQRVLVDLVALHVTLKQAHWVAVGPGFRSVHLAIDDAVADAREYSDTVAERLRALGAMPDGRVTTTAATNTLTELPLGEIAVPDVITYTTGALRQTVTTLRAVHDEVDDADPTSADLLHVAIEGLEKHAWLISTENVR